MPISYKKLFDLLEKKGWSTYRIRKEKLIGQGTLTALKNETGGLDSKTIARICEVLSCQPGDIMEYIPFEIFKRSHTQIMVNRQALSDAVKCLNHDEQFFLLAAKSSLRIFVETAAESFNKGIPLAFYAYMSPDASTPEQQTLKPSFLIDNPHDLWIKWGSCVVNEEAKNFISNLFHEIFPQCCITES